jgi:hypothetical protein
MELRKREDELQLSIGKLDSKEAKLQKRFNESLEIDNKSELSKRENFNFGHRIVKDTSIWEELIITIGNDI